MKKIRNISIIVLIKGILLILLGIFHIMAIFIFENLFPKEQMPVKLYHELVVWFILGGIFFIFLGVIDLISYFGLRNSMKWSYHTSLASGLFLFVISILGIIVFKEGPPFLLFVLGLIELVPLMLYRKEFSNRVIV